MEGGTGDLEPALLELVGPRLRAALARSVPPEALEQLAIRVGRTATMLKMEAEQRGAGLVILGSKHHLALGRWLGGSTAHDAIRTLSVPVLVAKGTPSALRRVLVAVDLSYAAGPAIREAGRFVRLENGQMRAIHVIEPLTIAPEAAQLVEQRFHDDSMAALEHDVWPLLTSPAAERTVRSGDATAAIAAEAADWRADLLVVGSHGKGWVERALLGTVTERLLNQLPVSLLVVPVRKPQAVKDIASAVASRA
jgi:nucleotide-binding universal stress UspA family protein